MLLNQEAPLSAQVTKVEMHCIDTNVKKTNLNQNLKDETVPELGPQGPNCQQKNSTGGINVLHSAVLFWGYSVGGGNIKEPNL